MFFVLALSWCFSAEAKAFKVGWPDDKKFGAQQRQHNWCQIEEDYWQDGGKPKKMQRAVHGKKVSVIILENPNYVSYNHTTGEIEGGFLIDVFEEVANRTGISWHETTAYSAAPDSSKGETYDNWIRWAMNHYDIVLGDFAATEERQGLGMRFGYPILNESPGLVAQVKVQSPPWYQTIFSWARPFDGPLWCLIILFFVFTGLVFSHLEPEKSILYKEEGGGNHPFGHSVWLTVASFTCGEKFKPHTWPAKVFVISWTFTVSLIAASYTANLASLLVVSGQQTSVITGVEDAIQKNLAVCVWKGGAYDKFMQDRYPDLALKYPKNWGYHNVRNGNCAAIVKDHTLFKIDQGRARYNKDCDLDMVGSPLTEAYGSFVSKADSSDRCTDFVMDAITVSMHSQYSDGWLRAQKEKFYRGVHDMSCPKFKADSSISSSLKVSQTGGIFALHVVTSVVCVLWNHLRQQPSPYRELYDAKQSRLGPGNGERSATAPLAGS